MTFCLAVSIGACGNTESGSSTQQGSADASGDTTGQSSEGDSGLDSDSAANDEDELSGNVDMDEITMVCSAMGAIPSGLQAVEDAINEITEQELNIHVTIEMIEAGSYPQQINLKMSSGEPFDLMITRPVGSACYSSMAAQNQFMDISGLLEEYGQGILDTVGDMIAATSNGDQIFGVPTWRSMVSSAYICMRTDVLEDLGLLEKAKNMTTFSEYEEIMQAVSDSEKWNHLAPMVASDNVGTCLALDGCYLGNDAFSEASAYDQLGDLNRMIAINPDGSDPTVISNFDSDEYRKMYDCVKKWYDMGFVYKDAATQTDSGSLLVKADTAFSYLAQGEIGMETSQAGVCGMPMTCVKVMTLPISTSSCTKFVWTVPQNSSSPEAAVKFLNMMYTDARIANLLAWGIEDVNYTVKDGVAYFVEGEDANNCAYHTNDFLYGNQFLVLPWDGQAADLREVASEEMANAQVSAYLGFSCDTTVIANELTALTNVISEFRPSVNSGIASPEDYEAFIEKLNNSGLDVVIETYQKQLDEWLQANK